MIGDVLRITNVWFLWYLFIVMMYLCICAITYDLRFLVSHSCFTFACVDWGRLLFSRSPGTWCLFCTIPRSTNGSRQINEQIASVGIEFCCVCVCSQQEGRPQQKSVLLLWKNCQDAGHDFAFEMPEDVCKAKPMLTPRKARTQSHRTTKERYFQENRTYMKDIFMVCYKEHEINKTDIHNVKQHVLIYFNISSGVVPPKPGKRAVATEQPRVDWVDAGLLMQVCLVWVWQCMQDIWRHAQKCLSDFEWL